MPSIEQNLRLWNEQHDWTHKGDRWSSAWGGPEMQWFGSIYPRIRSFLPAAVILEIAPGYGRWTEFLKNQCQRLELVDLSPACIDACRQRFSADAHLCYHVNDGKSLEMVADDSVDFAFSFDSLVHAEEDVMRAYVCQLGRKLSTNGAAFLHHSNLGAYPRQRDLLRWPRKVHPWLKRLRLMEERVHWRAWSMSAEKMQAIANECGLTCVTQELIPWSESRILLDCMTLLVRKGAARELAPTIWPNRRFMDEADHLGQIARNYPTIQSGAS